jgi:hypothetical protein
MTHKMLLLSALLAGAFGSQTVLAQTTTTDDPSAPKTREQVKAETRDAAATGKKVPVGEQRNNKRKPVTSETTREQVKSDTKAAKAMGEMKTTEGDLNKMPPPAAGSPPPADRADVKAETKRAMKNGEIERSEESGKPKN